MTQLVEDWIDRLPSPEIDAEIKHPSRTDLGST